MKRQQPDVLASALRDFFSDHLPRVCGMSPHTLHSYRDALILLLRFEASRKGRSVTDLSLADLEPAEILAFLRHLETERGNAVSTRNIRLAALHTFFRYLGTRYPEHLEHCQRILSIPTKRTSPRPVEYLEYDEMEALLSAVDRSRSQGRRDYALLATLLNTGARVQEALGLRARDLRLSKPFQVRLLGKGRKERVCPIWPQTAQVLRDLCEQRNLDMASSSPVFVNQRGEPLTRFGVRYLLAKYLERARHRAPSLASKRLHPHSLRHSTAIHLLKSGVDLTTISQWLGHASVNTTQKYATLDLDLKRQALARAEPLTGDPEHSVPWRQNPEILAWLESL